MTVAFSEEALRDLDEILAYVAKHYPAVLDPLERRIHDVLTQIAEWPESKARVGGQSDVRVAFLGKYPYRIFYRPAGSGITVLHIHHAARRPWRPEP